MAVPVVVDASAAVTMGMIVVVFAHRWPSLPVDGLAPGALR